MNKKILHLSISLLVLVALPTSTAFASYEDDEGSTGNTLSATTLDISLKDDALDDISEELFEDEDLITPTTSVTKEFYVQKEGDLDFKYNVDVGNTSGDPAFCAALGVVMEIDGSQVYDSVLLGLESEVVTISSGINEVSLEVYLNDTNPALQDNDCDFDLVVTAWQVGGNSSSGFTDEETIVNNELTSGYWAPPDVTVVVPNGGEVYGVGDTVDIEWTAVPSDPSATITDVDIYLSKDGGASYPDTIVLDITSGPHPWVIDKSVMVFGAGESADTMKIKIVAIDSNGFIGEDESDANFDPVLEDEEDEDEDKPEEVEENNDTEDEEIPTEVEEGEESDAGSDEDAEDEKGVEESVDKDSEEDDPPASNEEAPEDA